MHRNFFPIYDNNKLFAFLGNFLISSLVPSSFTRISLQNLNPFFIFYKYNIIYNNNNKSSCGFRGYVLVKNIYEENFSLHFLRIFRAREDLVLHLYVHSKLSLTSFVFRAIYVKLNPIEEIISWK